MKSVAFLSYKTANKEVAGKFKSILTEAGISSFLAHEDIEVSEEWRRKILEKIGQAKIFIALLSEDYFKSAWCVQESGIAAYRSKEMTIIPISIDGTIPEGFIGKFQSAKIEPDNITIRDLIPGLLRYDFNLGIKLIIDLVKKSGSYRCAENDFELILPHILKMNDCQIKSLLECAEGNGQVCHASLCAKKYLPPLLDTHGHLLDSTIYTSLKETCEQYA